jgi:2-polyprenyl-6-methoxyphenol hydroxylase-like FAD-dependent oxidoreductase
MPDMSVAIVGNGYGALHLALRLQKDGRDPDLFSDRTSAQLLAGKLSSTACHWGTTRQADAALDVDFWQESRYAIRMIRVYLGLPQPVRFETVLGKPGYMIDHRVYQSRLLDEFVSRGGKVTYGPVEQSDLAKLNDSHAATVVATGRGGLQGLFERIEAHCPYSAPQRLLCSGFYDGFDFQEMTGVKVQVAPGVGEMFEYPAATLDGKYKIVFFFFAIPGSPLEAVVNTKYEADPAAFHRTVLGALKQFFPESYARVDLDKFGAARAEDVVQGAVTPSLRRAYAKLPDGKFVLALGDVHSVNDPIMGQGANVAIRSADMLADLLAEDGLAVDEWFCTRYDRRTLEFNEAVQGWNNLMLRVPPEQHVLKFLATAAANQTAADDFGVMFDQPLKAWRVFSSAERTEAYLAGLGRQSPSATAAR